MRTTLGLALLVLAFAAAPARADDRPAMAAQQSSFELFGRSVCFANTGPRCDVQLAHSLIEAPAYSEAAKPKVWRFLGLTFCAEPHATGPACDVVWVPPTSTAVAWRDIRMGVLP